MNTVIHSFPVWLPQTQTWMYNQLRFLPEDIERHVVCERTENLSQFSVPNIHCRWERSTLRNLWDKGLIKLGLGSQSDFLFEQIRAWDADLVHSHFGPYGWRDMNACTREGTPQIVTFYGQDVDFYPRAYPQWRDRYRELFHNISRVLCEGPHMATRIISNGCPEEKVLVHRLGIALDNIPFTPRNWDGKEPLRVLLASSFREKKGIPIAIRALGRLHVQVELEITLIGDVDSRPSSEAEKRRILKTIESQGLQDKVRLLGYQPHAVLLEEAYKNHIYMAPSVTARDGDTEGGAPITIIEMAASGMPVVSSRHCDIPEIIEHGKSGFLAEEHDVDGLVQCLQNLVENPIGWHDISVNARRHIELKFNARKQGEDLAQIYRGVTAR